MEQCVSSVSGWRLQGRPYNAKHDPPKLSRAFQKDAAAEFFSAQRVSFGCLSDAGYTELWQSHIDSIASGGMPEWRPEWARTRSIFKHSILHRANAVQLQFASTDRAAVETLLKLLTHLRLRPWGVEALWTAPLLKVDPAVYTPPTWTVEQLALTFSTRYMVEQDYT
ncbi:hypothetical protein B484DRAFT_401520 [Ochromonadaceae sp. CCMP2298]|nr:hypothetical protein B484DRAFT_401520 [Ochromonadaceae sp. CCMP2298]